MVYFNNLVLFWFNISKNKMTWDLKSEILISIATYKFNFKSNAYFFDCT